MKWAVAKNEYKSYIMIDFAETAKGVTELFDDISDLNYLFLQLQLKYKVDLHERNSVIIFDEVQLCPKARQAIRVLLRDHRYDYIETGSLISIKKNVDKIRIPSEERKISMFPMPVLSRLERRTRSSIAQYLEFPSKRIIGLLE